MTQLANLLQQARQRGASDLMLSAGSPPTLKVFGQLDRLGNEALTPAECKRLLYEQAMTDDQRQRFDEQWDLDFALHLGELGRFRLNVSRQRSSVYGVVRMIPSRIPTLEELDLPPRLADLTQSKDGLILVTGPTGSGKSTTLAAMLDYLNAHHAKHIITFEDPIEYFFLNKRSVIEQRELGVDVQSFSSGLRSVLRQAPDVVLVGELRDRETIEAALTVAETGHLVMGTLHTRNAAETVSRIIDTFPGSEQERIAGLLASHLVAVFAQRLLPEAFSEGLVVAYQLMIMTDALRSNIREMKPQALASYDDPKSGSLTLERRLLELIKQHRITPQNALRYANSPQTMTGLLDQSGLNP